MNSPPQRPAPSAWMRALLLLGLLAAGLALLSAQMATTSPGWWAARPMVLTARLTTVALALALWFQTQALIGSRRDEDGIVDRLHRWSAPWNAALWARPRLANRILIGSTACIDAFGLFLIGAGMLGPTLRPFVALLILFGFRQLCQAFCGLPTPPKMIWRNPGVPSLFVTYGTSNDFFISGHTAIAVLGAIECFHYLPWWCGMAATVIALGEAAMVIILRAHYTMDVLAAIVAAWCAADLAMRLCLALGI